MADHNNADRAPRSLRQYVLLEEEQEREDEEREDEVEREKEEREEEQHEEEDEEQGMEYDRAFRSRPSS